MKELSLRRPDLQGTWAKPFPPGAALPRQMIPVGTFHPSDYPETTEAYIRAGANDHRQFKSAGRKD